MELSSNYYGENFGSNGEGLIDIEGILIILFSYENYFNNGENNYQA